MSKTENEQECYPCTFQLLSMQTLEFVYKNTFQLPPGYECLTDMSYTDLSQFCHEIFKRIEIELLKAKVHKCRCGRPAQFLINSAKPAEVSGIKNTCYGIYDPICCLQCTGDPSATPRKVCGNCNKSNQTLIKCRRCCRAFYCSPACREQGLQAHKSLCDIYAALYE